MFFWQAVTGSLALLGTVFLATPASAAATDLESFERLIARSATEFEGRPKAGCVCQDGSANHGLAGELQRVVGDLIVGGRAVIAACNVPKFDSNTGALLDRTNCFTFETLPR
jgi:hypothetical protein